MNVVKCAESGHLMEEEADIAENDEFSILGYVDSYS